MWFKEKIWWKIERFRLYNTNQNYINNFLIEFNGNGVLRYHKYICNKCHNKIKPKKSRKTNKNNDNNNNNNDNNNDNNKVYIFPPIVIPGITNIPS